MKVIVDFKKAEKNIKYKKLINNNKFSYKYKELINNNKLSYKCKGLIDNNKYIKLKKIIKFFFNITKHIYKK